MYDKRIKTLTGWMASEGISMVVFSDFEQHRDPSVRYFSGHPTDAVLCVAADGKTMLAPWDINLAQERAHVDTLVEFTHFARNECNAVGAAAGSFNLDSGDRIEISEATSYPRFLQYVEALSPFDVLCRENGVAAFAQQMRSIKDDDELVIIRQGAAITNDIIDHLEKKLRAGSLKTEYDVASFIEREALAAGCEGLGFTTLAAGPERSFGIHAFPPYTSAPFGTKGLSILDFGVVFGGYTSDVTLTVAGGAISKQQQNQLDLMSSVYNVASDLYLPGLSVRVASKKVNTLFSRAKRNMPHALGHGIGLEAHEFPVIKDAERNNAQFLPGMVCTLEPGLYDAKLGGCRLENDFLITDTRCEVLTNARILYV